MAIKDSMLPGGVTYKPSAEFAYPYAFGRLKGVAERVLHELEHGRASDMIAHHLRRDLDAILAELDAAIDALEVTPL